MVMPGSLDYLYHYGILDHIPYEAYEMTPMVNKAYAPMNGSEYLKSAMQGNLYDTYTHNDNFVKRAPDLEENEGEKFRNSIREALGNNSEKKANESPNLVKGFIAGAIVLGTLICCLARGKKAQVPPHAEPPSFVSKLNLKNWFKKK